MIRYCMNSTMARWLVAFSCCGAWIQSSLIVQGFNLDHRFVRTDGVVGSAVNSNSNTNTNESNDMNDTFECDRRRMLQRLAKASAVSSALLCSGTNPTLALSPEQAANDYNTYASNYDDLDGGEASSLLGIDQARSALFARASGHVLEIGAGTGLNLNKYDPSKLQSLTLLDISNGMLDEAQKRLASTISWPVQVPVQFVTADATSELIAKFGAGTFDTVVDSFSLCVMGNEGAKECLDQLRQVVKRDGKILLLENSRSSNPLLGMYQDATADAAAMAGGKGCVYNQDVRALISTTRGLKVDHEEAFAAGVFRSFQCSVV